MTKNKKLLGAVLLLAAACGKNDSKRDGLGGVEVNLTNPVPANENMTTDKEVVNNVINGADYSKGCGDEGVSCDGFWVLKQARCNDEPIEGTFKGEPVVINIKGNRAELQFDTDVIDSAEFTVKDSETLSFKLDNETTLEKSYRLAHAEGIMSIYLSGTDEKCASGIRKTIFTRLDSDSVASLLKKGEAIAAAKLGETGQAQMVETPAATPTDVNEEVIDIKITE